VPDCPAWRWKLFDWDGCLGLLGDDLGDMVERCVGRFRMRTGWGHTGGLNVSIICFECELDDKQYIKLALQQ
jgi:hypothetical protein